MPLWSIASILAGVALVAGSGRLTNAMRELRDVEFGRPLDDRIGRLAPAAFRAAVILGGAYLLAVGFYEV